MARVGAVLLAAGASRRFRGKNKLLARIDGKCLIVHVAEQLAAGAVDEIVVVTGRDWERVEGELRRLPARFVHNGNWQAGMGTSISVGIRALSVRTVAGAFIVPGDMPRLRSSVLRELKRHFKAFSCERIVYPATADGVQRNPVLWPRCFFADLSALAGRTGAKPLLRRFSESAVGVDFEDASCFVDIDTAADLTRVRAQSTPGQKVTAPS